MQTIYSYVDIDMYIWIFLSHICHICFESFDQIHLNALSFLNCFLYLFSFYCNFVWLYFNWSSCSIIILIQIFMKCKEINCSQMICFKYIQPIPASTTNDTKTTCDLISPIRFYVSLCFIGNMFSFVVLALFFSLSLLYCIMT